MVSAKSYRHEDVQYFKFGYNPIGKPFLFTHIYYIDGLLIDTGQPRARKKILTTLKDLDVNQLFITHHHEDHSGNISSIKALFDCEAYASPLCCEQMKNPPSLSFAQKMVWGDRPPHFDLIPTKGDELKTTKFTFQLIPIPGHASDMVALYEPDKKWLFSADLYINSYIGYFMDNESIIEQIQSIKRILTLDFDVMFCSHNPQLTQGKQKLEEKLNFLEEFNHNVTQLHRQGYHERAIFKALKLKEIRFVYLLSGGHLSKMNMIRSVIRDLGE